MILNKGKYTFVKVGFGNAALENKGVKLPVFSEDGKVQVGEAKILEENPLTLDLEISEEQEFPGSYFTIIPMNHTMQNGVLIKVYSFKLVSSFYEYKALPLSEDDMKSHTKKTRKSVLQK